jgi:hypothetical protein
MVFAALVLINVAANLLLGPEQESLTLAVGGFTLLPLLLLLVTGIYLFFLPYWVRARR